MLTAWASGPYGSFKYKGGSTMRAAWSMLLGLAVVLALVAKASAEDKEVTLKGTITCAKCDLKLEKKCHTVIKVKEGDKDVVYYLDDKSAKEHHKKICTQAKEGIVTGKVSKKGEKIIITASQRGMTLPKARTFFNALMAGRGPSGKRPSCAGCRPSTPLVPWSPRCTWKPSASPAKDIPSS